MVRRHDGASAGERRAKKAHDQVGADGGGRRRTSSRARGVSQCQLMSTNVDVIINQRPLQRGVEVFFCDHDFVCGVRGLLEQDFSTKEPMK